jgi:membrane-associated phospholipid phosphatase
MDRDNDNDIPADASEEMVSEQQNAGTISDAVGHIQQEVQSARRHWYSTLRQTRFLLVIYALLLVLTGGLAFWVHTHPVLAPDVAISQEFQESTSPWLKFFMIAVSYQGNTFWLAIGLVVVATVVLWLLRFRLEAVILLVVNVTSEILNVVIKLLVNRPRPAEPLVNVLQHANGQSFPSGHVMSYVAFWGLVFIFTLILFTGNRWWRIALLIFSGLCLAMVGPSRIYLGDHWASDVLGAYLIGGLWLWLWLWIYVKLKERGVLASNRKSDRPGAGVATK